MTKTGNRFLCNKIKKLKIKIESSIKKVACKKGAMNEEKNASTGA
jgi:hypothetical protein